MKIASLTSALLARKGSAAPSSFAPAAVATPMREYSAPVLEYSAPARSNATTPAPTARNDTSLVAKAMPHLNRSALPKLDHTGRVKVSLRLDPSQHLKLKLIAAHLRVSIQGLMTEALEGYLDQAAPESLKGKCACLGSNDASDAVFPKLADRSPISEA
jgi:hypothetical protein